MNKDLVVYTSFPQVMVHQKIIVFFYPSKLVPDFLGNCVIACGKLVYMSRVIGWRHELSDGTGAIGLNKLYKLLPSLLEICLSNSFWKYLYQLQIVSRVSQYRLGEFTYVWKVNIFDHNPLEFFRDFDKSPCMVASKVLNR